MNTEITNFIINNIGVIVLLLAAIVGLTRALVSKNEQKIFANLYSLISEAQQLVNVSNSDKFQYVLDRAYNVAPWWVKFFISEDKIKMAIVYSLSKVKEFAKAKASEGASVNTNIQTPAAQAAATQENAEAPLKV